MILFDLDSARRHLPEVRRLMRQAMEARAAAEDVRSRIARFASKAGMAGGARLSAEVAARWQADLAAATGRLREPLAALEAMGVQVKDLEIGLVDFPTLYRGREVLLCWRIDEPDIAWWHGLEEGYRGRKPVDGDFLANHRGG